MTDLREPRLPLEEGEEKEVAQSLEENAAAAGAEVVRSLEGDASEATVVARSLEGEALPLLEDVEDDEDSEAEDDEDDDEVEAETEASAGSVAAQKREMLERLQTLCSGVVDFQKAYAEFQEIQRRWVEIEPVPRKTDILQNDYVQYSRWFYTRVMRKSIRDYAYKKNEEVKESLCKLLEQLTEKKDVVEAFHQMRQLVYQWNATGFTSNRARRVLEKRFDAAVQIIRERHRKYVGKMNAIRNANMKAKVALCRQIEEIDYAGLESFRDWDEQYKTVKECQQKWYATGYADKEDNQSLRDRFYAAIGVFYQHKQAFYAQKKAMLQKNLELKLALCEKAEALKDNADRKTTAGLLIGLQKEWKEIGPAPYKESKRVWERFSSACDYFFGQKPSAGSSGKGQGASGKERAASGKERGASGKERGVSGKAWKASGSERGALSENGTDIDSLYRERETLMRTYDRQKTELRTYENNIGFFNVSSKGSGEMLKEMEKRIEGLKAEMARIVARINAIDEQLDALDKQIDEQIEK